MIRNALFHAAILFAICSLANAQALIGTTPLLSTVPIVSTSVANGYVVFNCGTQSCGVAPQETFYLTNNSNSSCNNHYYTPVSVQPSGVTASAGGCAGVGTGGSFANISPALTLNNAAAAPGNGAVFDSDTDGTLFLLAYGNGTPQSGITLDTTPRVSMYIVGGGGGGFAADEFQNTCVATGALVNPTHQCNDPHVWVWNNDGHLVTARGGPICTNGAQGNCVDVLQEYYTEDETTLSNDISNYTVYTPVAGSGPNDLTSPGAAGLYELTYWLKSLTAQPGVTMTVSISCVDELGNRIPVSSQPFPFSAVANVAQGSLLCYSESNQPIEVNFTHANGAQPTYHSSASLWKR